MQPERRNGDHLLMKLHSPCAGLGVGGSRAGCLSSLEAMIKVLEAQPARPGNSQVRTGAEDTPDAKWIESRVDRCRLKAKLGGQKPGDGSESNLESKTQSEGGTQEQRPEPGTG